MSLFPVYCCCCCRRRPLDDDDGGERERLRAPQSVRQLQCATDGGFAVNVEMKGYNFSLSVESTQSIPKQLQQVQQCVKELCASTKSIIAADPKLQEMINSMVQSEEENLERVKLASNTYQDQTRCLSNMRMNFKEIKRAKELSNTYREAAYSVLRDMAQVAGINV
ncbi:uncharacterized protein si:ch73-345f18.3 isoform X2 [Callorhinchus milii]|uniref:uncharacterized protein si:ch73-345f18.3 isoform X2 n=1 Tax=Callorhinchus milii TaxID=7868 RepID=UPI0004573512|nr:uncharacterized protein si:ch73-345f18.3 isoform X2 [Callorhinchus milii]|eukprot:gi/632937884/ref/XP_007901423.1/ PREDICTED: uncharacterized protein LOC103184955 isoform X2 [Callorhinchus milii]